MRISVIICTYGRAAVLADLLASLDAQTFRDFETLVVDGNTDPSPARTTVEGFRNNPGTRTEIEVIASPRGLTLQRNAGINYATGELICFLDDDVTLPGEFLLKVSNIFKQAEFQDVGGLTGYDVRNYATPMTLRWRLRKFLGVIPGLPPGGVDRLGRGIPLSFLKPFKGFKEVGLLPGFCMIYRRAVIGNLRFDEMIPTYAGEDRDFSMQIGWRSRMLICGDLILTHHATPVGRDSEIDRHFQSAFGMGRRFAKYSRGGWDYLILLNTFLGDSLIDLLFLFSRPTRLNFSSAFVRMKGFFVGLRSKTSMANQTSQPPGIGTSEPQNRRASSIL